MLAQMREKHKLKRKKENETEVAREKVKSIL